jgi:hypothetical protein
MKSPSPPAPTPPDQTAAAQTRGDVATATATAYMQPNQYSPFGTMTRTQTGTRQILDAQGKPIDVPTFDQTMTLSPDEQAKYDLENRLAGQAGGIAEQQLGRLETSLSQPIVDPAAGKNYDTYRDNALATMRQRLQPQLDRRREADLTALYNQGHRLGSTGYTEEKATIDRGSNDAELAMILASGDEAQRAQSSDQAALQSLMAVRNQPLNEISALMGQSQVNLPQFQQFGSPTVPRTDYAGIVANYDNARMQAYQAQQANRSSMMGGLFGLGSSLLRLPFMMG